MGIFLRRGLPALALAGLPALAWAQDYEMLTLAEAAYLHSGLAMQAMLRNSTLKTLPAVIMICCTMWLIYRRVTSPRPQPIAGIIAYWVSCGLILILFWPEAAPRFTFAGSITKIVKSDGTVSWVARQGLVPVVNARDSGLVPDRLRGDAVVPLALDLILGAVTEMPLLLARGFHPDNMERPFSRVPVLQEFVEDVESAPPPSLVKDVGDFSWLCYEQAITNLMAADSERTREEVMPWSPVMARALGEIRLQTSAMGHADCQAFYQQELERKTIRHLRGQQTAQGSNKARVVRENLDIGARDQARMFIMRELERQVLEVQRPNRVTAAKRALEALSSSIGVVSNFQVTAPLKSTGTELQKHIDRMARFLGIGSFLVYWGPYIVGIAMFVTLAFFPVVLLWSLFPGQHFKPLVNYFLVLIFVCSTPLWWGMVDAAAEVAYAQHPTGGWFDAPARWGVAYTSYMVVTVIGIVMVPVMQATLLFGTWRAIGGMWSA